jgi:hypothetical protein
MENNNNTLNQTFCTQCPRHCPVDQLSCGRARSYFASENADSVNTESENENKHEHNHEHEGKTRREHGHEHRNEQENDSGYEHKHEHDNKHEGKNGHEHKHKHESECENEHNHGKEYRNRHGKGGEGYSEEGSEKHRGKGHHGHGKNRSEGDAAEKSYYGVAEREINLEEASLSQLLRRSGFIAGHKNERHEVSKDSEGSTKDIFDVLSDDEKASLRNILVKLLSQWTADDSEAK